MKVHAERLIAMRDALRNADANAATARRDYIKAERDYITAMGNQTYARVYGSTVISVVSIFPDGRDGERLDFEDVEVLA